MPWGAPRSPPDITPGWNSTARGRYLLKKGKNLQKDQSYVLYRLTQAQLARTQMPLGEIDSKDAIRALAAEAGLRVAQKKDSQDICFIPDGDYVAFLRRQGVALTPGDFVDEAGTAACPAIPPASAKGWAWAAAHIRSMSCARTRKPTP